MGWGLRIKMLILCGFTENLISRGGVYKKTIYGGRGDWEPLNIPQVLVAHVNAIQI